MTKWILKKSAAKRFETGHPWVFSNEIESVKGCDKGDFVDLHNTSGRFLARGFANPASLISFRRLSEQKEEIDHKWLVAKIFERRKLREQMGLRASRRLSHGEADGMPGLVIDEFLSDGQLYWSIHVHTAGMERMFNRFTPASFLKEFAAIENLKGVVLRRDSKSREMEGLTILEPEVAGEVPEFCRIDVDQGEILKYEVNFKEGQKGGFFLDQRKNVSWLRDFLKYYHFDKNVRILDAFCYCGQWGIGCAHALQAAGFNAEVAFADSSETALEAAMKNAKAYSLSAEKLKLDLVDQEWPWSAHFDVVVCDPPALIKSKKHYFAGRRAYLKIILRSLKALKSHGIFVASSCSFHLSRYDLLETLLEAQMLLGIKLKIVHEFSLPPDHPRAPEFPEGDYLKGFICLIG